MNKKLVRLNLTIVLLLVAIFLEAQVNTTTPFAVVKPIPEALQGLPIGAVKPKGWLRKQLQQNLAGFTGHLDSLAPDLILDDDIYGRNRIGKQVKSKNLGAVGAEGEWQAQYLW